MTEPLPPPLQADSPVMLPDGTSVPRYRPPEVGGGSFTVDLARAPEAIRELEAAREELNSIRRDALDLGRVTPPTNDLVTLDAANLLGVTATGGPGSFVSALDAGIAQVEALISNVRVAMDAYRGVDEQASSDLS
ncbi:hypothetical protein ACFPK1_01810 [Actinomycetospora rhizophila]|uniref:PE family protein n=1 Tax=Actinomycetospora rhizophila TaxID=1416876 RepID=A0ABV9Z8E1_9PSEU